MKNQIYLYEEFLDSSTYFNQKPSKYIVFFISIIVIITLTFFIFLFKVDKINYIKSNCVLTSKFEPVNVTSTEGGKIQKIFVKNNDKINEKDKVIVIKQLEKNDEKEKLVKNESKLRLLKKILENIESYPVENNILENDINIKQYELFKAEYKEIINEGYNKDKLDLLKKQFETKISEKMEMISDEIEEFRGKKQSKIINIDANKSGYIIFPDDIKEDLYVEKGQLLYQIYDNTDKVLKAFIPDTDINKLKKEDEIRIKFESKDNVLKTTGKINNISYLPEKKEGLDNNIQFYQVTIDIKESDLQLNQQIYSTSGKVYIELKKQNIGDYLYEKLRY